MRSRPPSLRLPSTGRWRGHVCIARVSRQKASWRSARAAIIQTRKARTPCYLRNSWNGIWPKCLKPSNSAKACPSARAARCGRRRRRWRRSRPAHARREAARRPGTGTRCPAATVSGSPVGTRAASDDASLATATARRIRVRMRFPFDVLHAKLRPTMATDACGPKPRPRATSR